MRVEHIGDATLILADCMDIMRDMPDKAFELAIISNIIKPFSGTLNVGEITRACFKRRIFRHEHTADLRNVNTYLQRNFGLVRDCFTKFNNSRIVPNSLLVVVRAAQGIHAKIKRFWHVSVKQVSDFAGIKTNESEHINLSVIVSLGIVLAVALDVKNVCLAFLCSLRDNSRCGCSFNLNTKKALPVIHKDIIWESLLTRERNKSFHDKVCTNKVFASFTNLEFITKSHNITSNILYNAYFGMSSVVSNKEAQ